MGKLPGFRIWKTALKEECLCILTLKFALLNVLKWGKHKASNGDRYCKYIHTCAYNCTFLKGTNTCLCLLISVWNSAEIQIPISPISNSEISHFFVYALSVLIGVQNHSKKEEAHYFLIGSNFGHSKSIFYVKKGSNLFKFFHWKISILGHIFSKIHFLIISILKSLHY